MDIGIYVIQFAIMAFGGKEPSAVNAVGTTMTSGADETGSLMLQFGDGKFAHLVYSCKVCAPLKCLKWTLYRLMPFKETDCCLFRSR